jgi:tRNA A37 N6-isopentenylltransferase MiaA
LANDKVPIVVGGTNYYIESILWKILVQNTIKYEHNRRKSDPSDDHPDSFESLCEIDGREKNTKDWWSPPSTSKSARSDSENESGDKESKNENDFNYMFDRVMKMTVEELESQPSEMLHECLKIVDPASANRLHPNNRRKVIR